MSDSPRIVAAVPADKTQGVVLGTSVVVTFDQVLDTATINNKTFALFGPGQTQVLTPDALLASVPKVTKTNDSIPGTYTFSQDTHGNTVLTFAPILPLRPNVTYTVLAVGPGSATGSSIKNTTGDTLATNYQWTFATGDVNLAVPPAISPLPLVLPLDPAAIQVRQRIFPVGNDLTQAIDFIFPGPIDASSFTLSQILCSLEPLLNDLSVTVPSGLTTSASISGNTLSVQISGWPSS